MHIGAGPNLLPNLELFFFFVFCILYVSDLVGGCVCVHMHACTGEYILQLLIWRRAVMHFKRPNPKAVSPGGRMTETSRETPDNALSEFILPKDFYLTALNILILSPCYSKYDVNRINAQRPSGSSAAVRTRGSLCFVDDVTVVHFTIG